MAWTTKTKQKTKYNFDKLKLDFFRSKEHQEVKAFFLDTHNVYTSHIQGMTKGWSEEKREMISQVKAEVQEDLRNELKDLYRPSAKELAQMLEASMWIYKWKLFQTAQNIKKDDYGNIILPDWLDFNEQEKIRKAIKEEQVDLKIEDQDNEWNGAIQTIRII